MQVNQQQISNLVKELPLDKNLIDLAKAIRRRVRNEWDIVIAIDGEEGVGKSTLAVILSVLCDENFDINKNIAYLPTHAEVEEKFWKIGRYGVFLMDEAIKALYKMRFMDKLQTRITEMYATERWQNKITLLCIPRFTDLNEYFRNHRVKFWIHVYDRGKAVAFAKDDVNIATNDKWHLKEEYGRIKYITRGKKYAQFTKEDKVKIYRKSQHHIFDFSYPAMPEEVESAYVENKKFFREIPEQSDKNKIHDVILKLKDTGMKQIEIAKMVNMNQQSISRIISKYKKN